MGSSKEFIHPIFDTLKKAIEQTLPGSMIEWDYMVTSEGNQRALLFSVPVAYTSGRETEYFGFGGMVSRDPVINGYVLILVRIPANLSVSGNKKKVIWNFGGEDLKALEGIKRGMENKYPHLSIERENNYLRIQWIRSAKELSYESLCEELKTFTNCVFALEIALRLNSEGEDGQLLALLGEYTSASGYLYSDPLLQLCEEGLRKLPDVRYYKADKDGAFTVCYGPYTGILYKVDNDFHYVVEVDVNLPLPLAHEFIAQKIPYMHFGENRMQLYMVGQGIDKPEEVTEAVDGSVKILSRVMNAIDEAQRRKG